MTTQLTDRDLVFRLEDEAEKILDKEVGLLAAHLQIETLNFNHRLTLKVVKSQKWMKNEFNS